MSQLGTYAVNTGFVLPGASESLPCATDSLSEYHMTATFNSKPPVEWYLGTDGKVGRNQIDFVSVRALPCVLMVGTDRHRRR